MEAIDKAVKFSNEKLRDLRIKLERIIDPGQLIITCGSYARREASPSSDLDYYAILDGKSDFDSIPEWDESLREAVKASIGKLPSSQGAFATNVSEAELLRNYGGAEDSNATITRRMLYLLEGEFLTNETKFRELRTRIIERYVDNTPRDHQIAFYLLNDIVRYWRTLAVDYAEKTYGSDKPKPWPVRNLKLIFSRKLIYASGLFSVALTADRSKPDKIEILDRLFGMTPLKRIAYVSGEHRVRRLFEMYDLFLKEISDPNVRMHLDGLGIRDAADDLTFRKIKNEGHYFSRELMSVLSRTFHSSHPIHMAVIF